MSYGTVHRWVARFGTSYAADLRRDVRVGRMWQLDGMATPVGGRLHWLRRTVDEHRHTLDVLRQVGRQTRTAARFFRCLLEVTGGAQDQLTTDQSGRHAAALA